MNDGKLISIAIPTFNRAHLVSELLLNIQEVCIDWREDIEIVVSDNGSNDDTEEVVKSFAATSSMEVIYHRYEKNYGVSVNLVGLYNLCSGKYFVFLGDDDRLRRYGFNRLAETLRDENPSAVFQRELKLKKPPFITMSYLVKNYFYHYGNAYKGVVSRKECVEIIRKYNLQNEIVKTIWPQTIIAFLVVYEQMQKGRKPILLGAEIGISPLHDSLNVKNFEYYHRTFFDLANASFIVDKYIPKIRARRFLKTHANGFYKSLLTSMLQHAQTETVDRQMLKEMPNKLHGLLGYSGLHLSVLLLVFRSRKLVRLLYRLIKRQQSQISIEEELSRQRQIKESSSKNKLEKGVRYLNYWDAD